MKFYDPEMSRALTQAQDALNGYEKAKVALRAAEQEIPVAITGLRDAERELQAAEVSAVLNGGSEPKKARAALTEARSKLDGLRARVAGLQEKLRDGEALVAAKAELDRTRPGFNQSVKAEFERQYLKAVAAFNETLTERAALERALGESFNLPAPSADTAEAKADLALPFRVSAGLDAAIQEAANTKRAAEVAAKRRPAFNADATYTAIAAFDHGTKHYEPGDLVMAGIGQLGTDEVQSLYERRRIAMN
jgi:hypothetical protein